MSPRGYCFEMPQKMRQHFLVARDRGRREPARCFPRELPLPRILAERCLVGIELQALLYLAYEVVESTVRLGLGSLEVAAFLDALTRQRVFTEAHDELP